MELRSGKSSVFRACRILLTAGARILVPSLILLGTGCIIIPVPSFSPEYETGLIDEATLESLIGLERDEVMRQIGWPDYSGSRGHSYVMVYQGEKRYRTDIYEAGFGYFGGGVSKIGTDKTIFFYCQVLELDENKLVQSHDVIAIHIVGRTTRGDSENTVDPIADCSEVVWKPDERKVVLTKSAILEVQAEAGDRAAALALATEFDDLTYLKAMAQERDSEATLLLARQFHDLTYLKVLAQERDSEAILLLAREFHDVASLKVLAQQGDIEAAKELVELTGESTEALRELAESGDLTAATLLARHAHDVASLKVLAQERDSEAILLLAREFHDVASLKVLAQQGDIEAAKELVELTGESTEALRELAESGDLTAATLLARHAHELGPLKYLAENGNYQAAHTLADVFDDDTYLVKLGQEGDYVVAYKRYQRLRSASETALTAWRLLCLGANAGYAKAQAEVGYWHRSITWENWRGWNERGLNLLRKAGVNLDDKIAYMWYTLAVSNGDVYSLNYRNYYVAELSPDGRIAQAEQMARDWKPGDCPSAEHRLGVPGSGPE